jgi:hypothetical protein
MELIPAFLYLRQVDVMLLCKYKKFRSSWIPMVHAYNPGLLGSLRSKDHGSRPAWKNSLRDPHL